MKYQQKNSELNNVNYLKYIVVPIKIYFLEVRFQFCKLPRPTSARYYLHKACRQIKSVTIANQNHDFIIFYVL